MSEVVKNQSFFKKLLDSRWAWNVFQAPMYNKLIEFAAAEIYDQVVGMFDPPENALVLDVGSGPGFSTLMVAKQFPTISITGVDYSKTMVEVANKNMAAQEITNCRFTMGDAMALPFPDDYFDMAISVASIKHWPDGAKGLSEIRRVLKPGGKALAGEALRDAPHDELMKFAALFAEGLRFKFPMMWFVKKVVFGMSYTCEEAEQLAIEAGFENVNVQKIPDWPFLMLTLKKGHDPI